MLRISLVVTCLFVLGCGGGNGGSTSDRGSDESPQTGGGSSMPPISAPDPIDCSNLDPQKVYIFGSLQEDEHLYAIADVEDATNFCVGFDEEYTYKGVVNSTGNYIYAVSSFADEPILSLTPEELTKDIDGMWVYPPLASLNDTVLFTPPNDGCGLSTIEVQPDSEEIYYSCPNRIVNTTRAQPYFDIGSNAENKILTVLPDGGMLLVDDPEGIKYVDPNQNEVLLTMPYDSRYIFGNAKQFIDSSTGNLSVWVAVATNLAEFYGASGERREELFRRLKVNITTMVVVDEGGFMPLPSGFVASYFEGEFDGDGNLYQPGRAIEDLDDDWVVKRGIKTGNTISATVYKESDLYLQEVYAGPEDLCTEQELLFGDTDICNDGVYDWKEQDNLFIKYNRRLITGM